MSLSKRPSFAIEAISGVSRRPSWISRKRGSTRPPESRAPRPPALPTIVDEAPSELEPNLTPFAEPSPLSVDLGIAAELARITEENERLHSQVAAMAATMARLRREVLESSEPELVRLASAIAERIVGRELATDPALVVAWAREAIQSLAAKDEVVIALARDVAQQVSRDAWSAIDSYHRVQTDPLLTPGAIEVRAAEGTISAGADARIAAVAQALGLVNS
jgi:hypothetical protein